MVDPAAGSRRAAKTAERARRKQEMASEAVANAADNPALGALNRHLNMMMQQLNMAHRVIGRVAAERDALRQQLADLQGIPIDDIKVTTIGTASVESTGSSSSHTAARAHAPEQSTLQRLNFLGGEDIAVVRKRRQMFVGVLILIGTIVWLIARQNHWEMPADISKGGLAALPFVGQFMTLFLAGWLLFRVARVSSKGIRWVFPTDDRKRRRR